MSKPPTREPVRPEREVIFEIRKIGDAQRVAAIDVATGTEVVIQAPVNAALSDVRALALRKLHWVLGERSEDEDDAPNQPNLGRGGKLI